MPVKKELIYPFFLECTQFCPDSFWENIFVDLSYGKTPHGSFISKEYISCRYKTREFDYKIEKKEAKQLYEEIYDLFKNKLGILSQREKTKKKLAFHDMENIMQNSRVDWSTIRRKNIKDAMYEKYVIDAKKKYKLTSAQSSYLLSLIIICIAFKTITSADIVFSDDKIQSIKGIEFEKGKIILNRPLCSGSTECQGDNSVKNPPAKATMSDNWKKYLENLIKKII